MSGSAADDLDDPAATVLVTGASGFLGGLAAAALLEATDARLVLPGRHPELSPPLARAVEALDPDERARRVHLFALTDDGLDAEAAGSLEPDGWDLVHCAGCLDYFDEARLQAGNVELTERLLAFAERHRARRFVHVSTAFACGVVDGVAEERPHDDPPDDPTAYTRSKREAERRVLGASVPSVIVRPSIVIGDSRDGRYDGKRYGLYQLWEANARLCTRRYLPELHVVAPKEVRPNCIHQDAFTAGLVAAWRHLEDGAICHLVSREATLPSLRDLWLLWLRDLPRPRRLHCYDRLDQIDLEGLDRTLRTWVEFTGVNLEISAHRYRFETAARDRLEAAGHLRFADATLASVYRCQQRFVAGNARLQRFAERHAAERAIETEVIEHP